MSPLRINGIMAYNGYVLVDDCVDSEPYFEEQHINETLNVVENLTCGSTLDGYAWGCILRASNKCDLVFGKLSKFRQDVAVATSSP